MIAEVVIKQFWSALGLFALMLALYGAVLGLATLTTWLWGPVS